MTTLSTPGAASATLGYDEPSGEPPPPSPLSLGLDQTVAHTGAVTAGQGSASSAGSEPLSATTRVAGRSTVLPRRSGTAQGSMPEFSAVATPRYEKLKVLGEGGAGEVSLELDQDIQRKVAVKRLRPEVRSVEGLLRFADEVRVVGQLEHPGIVPVHDVGVDEEGKHYLVMKYLKGDTLETIIEKLRAGDVKYLATYTVENRVRIFLSLLQAMHYAHEHDIIHRDLKPANIMVGPYGEVTIMDWGLAKKVKGSGPEAPAEASDNEDDKSLPEAQKLLRTQHGAILGTPLYMSPEQAAGRIDALDGRSDLFSLSLLFLELLALRHPLGHLQTVHAVVAELCTHEWTLREIKALGVPAGVPVEYLYFLELGLKRDPAERYASVHDMEQALQSILDGNVTVQCPITLSKNVMHRTERFMDRYPWVYILGTSAVGVFALFGLVAVVWTLVHALH